MDHDRQSILAACHLFMRKNAKNIRRVEHVLCSETKVYTTSLTSLAGSHILQFQSKKLVRGCELIASLILQGVGNHIGILIDDQYLLAHTAYIYAPQ